MAMILMVLINRSSVQTNWNLNLAGEIFRYWRFVGLKILPIKLKSPSTLRYKRLVLATLPNKKYQITRLVPV